ncbi:GTPase Era [Geomonas sp. RF6]|uniref:GTPase Era n=1 Tax=Geomonas sp. RF6 TaxID=2897342 RepID=UPI001E37A7F5|nr:GTPase Era [Geomonas sp. RF6]UFS68966.1 GTPase Era [Geomonas sp. RF6]
MAKDIFRSGFVSIVGRPNVGKSTLLNRILGEKVVITSDKPQTTRNRIQGIHNIANGQIVFIDTPGIHKAKSRLNKFMVDEALAAVQEVDVILFLVEAGADPAKECGMIDEVLGGVGSPVILVMNKIDLVPKEKLLAKISRYQECFPFRDIFPVSASTGDGVDDLVELVHGLLPEGPQYFPEDILTDVPERFVVAEIVREKIMRLTHDEVPYSVAVVVDSFKERENGVVAITATINVERDSQKGIVIGKRGAMLKRIGTEARQEIQRLLDAKVFLELFVRVSPEWSDNSRLLKEFGY